MTATIFLRRRPLILLACAGLILALAVGMRQSFGLFLRPMSADLGWSREVFALAIALQNIVWGATQPVVAIIADRFGAGRVIAASGLVYAAGLALMADTGSAGGFYLSAGVVVGLALSGTGFVVVLGAVGRYFPVHTRSAALGIASAGGSFGQFVMAPISQELIAAAGWPRTLLVFAVLGMVAAALGCGLRGGAESAAAPREHRLTQAIGEAGRHSGYLYLTAGFFVCGFQVTFIIAHLPAYFMDVGLSAATAATALGLIGLFNIAGSLLWGVLGDRYPKKILLCVLYTIRVAAMIALITLPPSPWLAYVFTAVMGVLWLGTIPLTGALVAQIFGPRYLSSLFGLVFFGHQAGAFLGVWLGGVVFDIHGSYLPVWWAMIALGAAAAIIHLPIDDRPVHRLAPA